MKKNVFFSIFFTVLFVLASFAKETNQVDPMQDALNEKNPAQKLQKLEEYYYNNRGQNQNLNKNVFIHIIHIASQLKEFKKVIEYGERALKYEWNNKIVKLNLYLSITNAYVKTGVNLAKAYNYSEFVINLSFLIDKKKETFDFKKKLIIPAYYLQMQILNIESADLGTAKKALKKAIELHRYDKSLKSANFVFNFCKKLYTLFQQHDQAIEALENICSDKIFNPEYLNTLALWYSRKKNKQLAVKYLKKSYTLKKDAKTAYSLGKLLQSIDIDSAIEYLADAFLLNDPRISNRAKKLLEHLYFNIKAEKKNAEEQEGGFQLILNSAKVRLGLKTSD